MSRKKREQDTKAEALETEVHDELLEAGEKAEDVERCENEPNSGTGEEVALLKEQLLRQAAEYDNYRKRTAREQLELTDRITAKNAEAFLPILDNIERALQADCSDSNYKKGIEMVYESFVSTLEKLGVEEITDDDFDPAVHQAVQHVELESGKVAQVFQKGYKIGTRIVRFAMVAIVK
jgi:molecular chaperone GrpE